MYPNICLSLDWIQTSLKEGGGGNMQNLFILLRHRVNRMLGFGWKEDCYALLYAMAKLMPKSILDIIYKTVR